MVEFAVVLPVFVLMIFGLVQVGLLMWTQAGLQHGVEMAARCAAFNTTLCDTVSTTQTIAAEQSYGLNPPTSTFAVNMNAECGSNPGILVSLAPPGYTFNLINYIFKLTLNAQSCYPCQLNDAENACS